MAITYIDFYAENPIHDKTLDNTNIYDAITGNSTNILDITNPSQDVRITNTEGIILDANNDISLTTQADYNQIVVGNQNITTVGTMYINYFGAVPSPSFTPKHVYFGQYASTPTTVHFIDNSTIKIPGGLNGQVLSTDGSGNLSFIAQSGGGVTDADYGDITVSGSGSVWTINNNAVNFAKMQNINTNTLLGRSSIGTGSIEQISVGSGLTLSAGILTASGGGGGGSQIQVDTFTSSGTWTKPAFAKTVKVYCLPGGAGGGSGARGNFNGIRTGGGGGSSTGYSGTEFLATSLPSTVVATVGAGGSGGASRTSDNSDGLAGTIGGVSSFGTFVITKTNGEGFGGNRTNSQSTSSITSSSGISTLLACQSFQGRAGSDSDGNLLSGEFSGLTMGCGGGGAGGRASNPTTRNGGFFNNQLFTNTFGATNGAGGTLGNAGGNGTNNLIGYLYYGTSGGGGSYATAQATGAGGNGGYGAGGGGGAGSDNGFNSGAGGNGGNGLVIIISEG